VFDKNNKQIQELKDACNELIVILNGCDSTKLEEELGYIYSLAGRLALAGIISWSVMCDSAIMFSDEEN